MDCVLFTGKSRRGARSQYGGVRRGGRLGLAHRFVYEDAHGPIPEGLTIHHACENPLCLNVEHMVLMTRSEHMTHHNNQRYGETCQRGHSDWYIRPDGRRACRPCQRERQREYEARKAVAG